MILSASTCPKGGCITTKHCQDGSTTCDLIVCDKHGWGNANGQRWVESEPSVR